MPAKLILDFVGPRENKEMKGKSFHQHLNGNSSNQPKRIYSIFFGFGSA
jgi:hypothetical protein